MLKELYYDPGRSPGWIPIEVGIPEPYTLVWITLSDHTVTCGITIKKYNNIFKLITIEEYYNLYSSDDPLPYSIVAWSYGPKPMTF